MESLYDICINENGEEVLILKDEKHEFIDLTMEDDAASNKNEETKMEEESIGEFDYCKSLSSLSTLFYPTNLSPWKNEQIEYFTTSYSLPPPPQNLF